MDLSLILTGRDDDYGGNFIERLHKALQWNMPQLNISDPRLQYEIILVDWNPIDGKYLFENPVLKGTLANLFVKNVIVDQSVLVAEGLNPNTYYEYFAKNAGSRYATGDLFFLTNSDILLTPELIAEINAIHKSDDIEDYFYRTRYRGEITLGSSPRDDYPVDDLHHPEYPDACICGLYSGDASMFTRDTFMNVATGYNEGEPAHRTDYNQSAMDGEILWNVYKKGKQLKFMDAAYFHIDHGRPNPRDSFYSHETYENKPNWGFVDYETEQLNGNTTIIRA
jgi:hypothetical protein